MDRKRHSLREIPYRLCKSRSDCLWRYVHRVRGCGVFFAPVDVATRIGFGLVGNSGRSEFMVVYGGLELAIGIFLSLCARRSDYIPAGVLFALVSSACLFFVRAYTVLVLPDLFGITYRLLIVELVIVTVAISAWYKVRGAGRA